MMKGKLRLSLISFLLQNVILLSIHRSISSNAETTIQYASERSQNSGETKPNFIMIITDEHNLRTISCYQNYLDNLHQNISQTHTWGINNTIDTPNIDSLARDGVMFTNFFSVTPLCTPSRASFMSGKYPQNAGLPLTDQNHEAMGDDVVTFANILQNEANYSTAYFGKWHLNGAEKPGWSNYDDPSNRGRRFGFEHTKYMFNRGHFKLIDEKNGTMIGYPYKKRKLFEGKVEKHFTTDYLVDRSIEYMNATLATGENPFAMVISLPDPHGPNEVRNPYRQKYKNREFELPYTGKAALRKDPALPKWVDLSNIGQNISLDEVEEYISEFETQKTYQNLMQSYYGMVKCIDYNVGKLLTYLRDTGIEENTIVVFTSDHGDLLGEHARVNKGLPYHTSAGVPFLLRYPAKVRKGKTIKSATSSVDFVPTLLSLMNIPRPTGLTFDGVNVAKEILNDREVTNWKRVTYTFDGGKNGNWASAIMQQYKLVVYTGDVPWLFDMESDPHEIINFLDHPEYLEVSTILFEKLEFALENFNIPLQQYKILFWSYPQCWDSSDRIGAGGPYSTIATCEDLGHSVPIESCADETWKTHCPLTCKNDCCRDSTGLLYTFGETKTCKEMTERNCRRNRVQAFCPEQCGICSNSK